MEKIRRKPLKAMCSMMVKEVKIDNTSNKIEVFVRNNIDEFILCSSK